MHNLKVSVKSFKALYVTECSANCWDCAVQQSYSLSLESNLLLNPELIHIIDVLEISAWKELFPNQCGRNSGKNLKTKYMC